MTYRSVNPATGETVRTFGLALGGNARAGLEDTLYLRKGEQSPGNLPLVRRTVDLAAALDRPPASADEAAALLRLPPR